MKNITGIQFPQKINRLSNKKSQRDKKNFSHFLPEQKDRVLKSSSRKKKERENSQFKEKKEQQRKKKKALLNGKGQFIDVKV